MEINISRILSEDLMDYSASVMELGPEAPRITWANSLEAARTWGRQLARRHGDRPEDFYQDARDHFREYGAWDSEEIDKWTQTHVRALVIQEAAAGLRELESLRERYPDMTDEELADSGYYSGRIWVSRRDEDGEPVEAYLYLGN